MPACPISSCCSGGLRLVVMPCWCSAIRMRLSCWRRLWPSGLLAPAAPPPTPGAWPWWRMAPRAPCSSVVSRSPPPQSNAAPLPGLAWPLQPLISTAATPVSILLWRQHWPPPPVRVSPRARASWAMRPSAGTGGWRAQPLLLPPMAWCRSAVWHGKRGLWGWWIISSTTTLKTTMVMALA